MTLTRQLSYTTVGKIRQSLSGELAQAQASSAQVNFRDTVWEIQTGQLASPPLAPGMSTIEEAAAQEFSYQ